MDIWRPYIVSTLIGLLVGIEREKAHPQRKALGVRTFLLLSLLGAMAGGLTETWMQVLISSFALLSIAISYYLFASEDVNDHGLTTEFAAAIVFTTGYLSHQSPVLAAVIGPVVALVLFAKAPLHRFTAKIKPSELQAGILILLLAVSVMGVLQDKPIDPWGIFNPKKFGMIVLVLSALEFSGYVLSKMMDQKRSTLVIGFFGGLVSSTAVLLSSSRASLKVKDVKPLLASAVSAKIAALVEVIAIVAFVYKPLLPHLLVPIGSSILIGCGFLVPLTLKQKPSAQDMALRSPIEIKAVFKLSFLLAGILGAVAAAQHWLGTEGTMGLVFLTGLFELHGVTLATTTMFEAGKLSQDAALESILLAVAASLVAKIAISWFVNRGAFSRYLTLIFLAMGISLAVQFKLFI